MSVALVPPVARTTPAGPVAVVVAGAGARGGYEAGALSVLVPRLRAARVGPPLLIGTSAGALNAALFAAFAHLSPEDQAERALATWRAVTVGDVFRSPLRTGAGTAARGLGQLLRFPGARLTGLLDTAPLGRLVARAVDWERLHRNIDEGLASLAVVTTSGRDNRTTVFVDRPGGEPVPPPDDDRPLDYVAARIGPQHVLASAAIPVLFPPVEVPGAVGSAGGWHLDGGVRSNAPLKPALALGARALVAVATHPFDDGPAPSADAPGRDGTGDDPPPDVDDTIVRLLDAALVDRMVEDLRTLTRVNALVGGDRDGDGGRLVPYLAVAPDERATLGRLAAEVFEAGHRRAPGGVRAEMRRAELRVLGRLLLGDGPRRGDLLSFLYFDPAFVDASIAVGRRDALGALGDAPRDAIPWRAGRGTAGAPAAIVPGPGSVPEPAGAGSGR